MYEFKRIPDVEISIDTIESTNSQSVVGLKKTGRDIMLTITHGHSSDVRDRAVSVADGSEVLSYYNGKAFIFMSAAQAQSLIDQLTVLTRQLP